MNFLEELLPNLQHLGVLGYWLILAVTFGESFVFIGVFVPGTILLLVMGGLVPYDYYDFGDLAFFAILGAILGNTVSFELGMAGKVHIERWAFLQKYLSSGKAFFLKHQKKSILLGRFVGPIRPIIPFVAGVMDMPRTTFYITNVLSAFVWCFSYLLFGMMFGLAWQRALFWSSSAIGAASAICIVSVLAIWGWRAFKKRKIISGLVPPASK